MIGTARVKFVQQQLNALGHNCGKADGVAGKKTFAALDKIEKVPEEWAKKRRLIGFIQWLCSKNGIDAGKLDGYWGPQTEYAYETLVEKLQGDQEERVWRPEELSRSNPNKWPVQTPQKDLVTHYGDVGKNQVYVQLPFAHRLAWKLETKITRFQCHEKVHDSLSRVLKRVADAYTEEQIRELRLDRWGGCLNVRKMRGGSRYSMHSWGIALDYDPANNKLKWGRDRAAFARPEYDTWWRLWEEEGWISLGRHRNFDWMHVQAARL